MQDRFHAGKDGLVAIISGLVLSLAGTVLSADSSPGDPQRLQELAYGEALFHSDRDDYFTAITRLLLAYERGLIQDPTADTEVLLARLKLAYGMHVEAGLDFRELLDKDVPDEDRNRAWYELAKTFLRKGSPEAARQALDSISGRVPEDLIGNLQLLDAHVLMAIGRNREAAERLAEWRGDQSMAAYAFYNRGMALIRAGDYEAAAESLILVADMKGGEEELLALKDKANLNLGYIYSNMDEPEQARSHLQKVRLEGPFSNRALLADGWISQSQGQYEDALIPWKELRRRNINDPAVLESLLAVPYVNRELKSLKRAAHDYEDAVAVYNRELGWLDDAMDSVQHGGGVKVLLTVDPGSREAQDASMGNAAAFPKTHYFGRLLATRTFLETRNGYSDLKLMLHNLDQGLKSIDLLVQATDEPGGTGAVPDNAADPVVVQGRGAANAKRGRQRAGTGPGSRLPGGPEWLPGVERTEGSERRVPPPGIPVLPEIDLPPDHQIEGLPETGFAGLPASESFGLPGAPEITHLPGASEDSAYPEYSVLWYPETGRFQFPDRGDGEDPYPEFAALDKVYVTPPHERRFMRRIEPSVREADAVSAGPSAGDALLQLADALRNATDRMKKLGNAIEEIPHGATDMEDRIAALRKRILLLRERIARAIRMYEGYTRALALEELRERKRQLEGYLEHASLELAKTYDQATGE